MGMFLSMSGVIGIREGLVIEALRDYASWRQGLFEEAEPSLNDDDCLIVSEGVGGVTVLFPGEFFGWDDASIFLSRYFNKAVFSFHIHDSDLWMYTLYDQGEVVDQFNPIPEYWEALGEAERQSWKGDAAKVAKVVPGLQVSQIDRYLVSWDDMLEISDWTKAYSTDHHPYCSEWQLTDFMNKLGLDLPIDDSGKHHGSTYRFRCKPVE